MRVLVWATTFGADLWALAQHLDGREDIELVVLMKDPKLYEQQPVAQLFPLAAPVLSFDRWSEALLARDFTPDITVMDQWPPPRAPSPKGLMLWHGLGWKGPNDRVEFSNLHARIAMAFGDPTRPNPDFRWSCFGSPDLRHRVETSGFAAENCALVGAASHDQLRLPMDRQLLSDRFPLDVVSKKTVLIAPTWHYGDIFDHWGVGHDLFGRLLERIAELGANALVRLHDRHRYNDDYLRRVAEAKEAHPDVLFQYRDQAPDNYIPMQVADVLVTNFSSIANLFYATGRPTIHVYPVADADREFTWKTFGPDGPEIRNARSARFIWKQPLEDNGGLLARSFPQLLQLLQHALTNPNCTQTEARSFLDTHMLGADGHNCDRIVTVLKAML